MPCKKGEVSAMFDRLAGSSGGSGNSPFSDARYGQRALEGLQTLLARFLCAPEITLIDVGADPATGSLVLQVHVRSLVTWSRLGPPEKVNGIPLRAVVPDYDLEG